MGVKKMLIDDNIYQLFKSKYGIQVASSLIIFFEIWRQQSELMAMQSFPQRTSYYYRDMLLELGLLERTTDRRLIVPEQYNMNTLHCVDCEKDDNIFCKRDPDAKCVICDQYFCGAHIGPHLRKEHCVSLNNDHCTNELGNVKTLED